MKTLIICILIAAIGISLLVALLLDAVRQLRREWRKNPNQPFKR